ncbi:MAG: ABC transporter substrate-binding protein [Clostridium sp.]
MKKIIAIVMALTLCLSLAACNKTAQTSSDKNEISTEIKEPVTIEFWHAMNGENEVALKEITEDFNKKNEKVKVNLVYQGHYKELFSKLDGGSKANNLPAITMIYPNRLTAYIMNDLVEDLDPYVQNEKIGFDKETWADIPEFLRDNGIWNGKRYSLPFNKSTYLLFYNEDLLKQKGVKPPTNWEELKTASEKLTFKNGDKNVYGLALNQSVGIDSSFWVEQAGGHLINEEKDEILFNSKEGIKAYDFLTGMIKKGNAKIAGEEKYMTGPFGRGEAAMGISSTSSLPDIDKICKEKGINYKAVVLPKGEKKAALFSGTDVAIFNTNSPDKKLAAFQYIKFFMEKESQLKWGEKSGYLPLRKSLIDSTEFKNFIETKAPAKGEAIKGFEYGYCDPKVLNGYALHDNMSKALEQILQNGKSSKEGLDEAAKNARKEMDEAKKAFGK